MKKDISTKGSKKNDLSLDDRNALKRRYRFLLKLFRKKPAAKTEVDYYYDEPIQDKTILISGLGRSVRGSMQYLLNELNSNSDFKDYKVFVRVTKGTEETVKGFIDENSWSRTATVRKGFTRKMESCQYLVTESYFPHKWIKKPGQVMIDLWHGTPLKTLGVFKSGDICHRNAQQQKNFLSADYLLYPNEFTRRIMWDSYRITPLLSAKALMMGYPRTAGILKVSGEEKEALLATLAPEGQHVYAYMPTFRDHLSDEETIERETTFLDYMDGNLRDDQILYVNLHHHIKAGLDFSGYKHIKAFPPLIDSYHVLSVAEALISDYSSVFFDYMVTKGHIILYIEDLDSYLEHHGLNMDIESLPFDLARSREDVIRMLNAGKQYDDSAFYDEMCSHDAADNPEKLCRIFLGREDGLCLEDMPRTDTRKVIMYTDYCAAGRDTDRLWDVIRLSRESAIEIYVGCDEDLVSEDKTGAYPMLHNTDLVASRHELSFSSIGRPLRELYLAGKIPFRAAFRYLKYDYALTARRFYGDAPIDTICIYDTTDPELVLGLALADANRKVLFISERMQNELVNGNRFLKEAVKTAAQYCDTVAVGSEEGRKTAESVLRRSDREKIFLIESNESIIEKL